MKVTETFLSGLKVIELTKFRDDRGFFIERFNVEQFTLFNLNANIIQVNHSFSTRGVIRGLHFQTNPWQGKIVGCIGGVILDVAVDIRKDSATFGQHFAIELDSPEKMLYIPHGFAHGFAVLSDSAHLLYFTDAPYSLTSDNGIRYDSCGIDWKLQEKPLLSAKDLALPTLEKYAVSIKSHGNASNIM
jgi:dTDP-4-dehydrorhamnose 3,5-epimerase